jgi:tetratricopeptide (TPR) repeat protein
MSWELWLAWWISGRFREGHRWVTEAMEHSLSPWARTRASLVRAVMNYAQSYFTDALEWWTTAAELARDSGDLEGEAGGRAGIGLATMSLGDFARAQESLRAALAISEEIGYAWMASLTSIWLGTLLLVTGDAEGSVPVFERATAGARERGDRLVVYVGLFNLASAALALGDDVRAESLFRESVALSQETRDAANLAFALDGLAVVEGRRGDARRSALLLGAAQAMREAVEGRVYHYYLPDDALRERTRDAARAALGEEAFEEAWHAGLSLDLAGAASAAGSQGARPGHEDTATA